MSTNVNVIITSTGLSSQEAVSLVQKNVKNKKRALIVPTASKNKRNNKYVRLAKNQLHDLGFTIDYWDWERTASPSHDVDLIYVSGGNTPRLMHALYKNKHQNHLEKILKKGATYMGVSAGSIILGPTIKTAYEVLDDEKTYSVWKGLNWIHQDIVPHYSKELDKKIQFYCKDTSSKDVFKLSNSDAEVIKIQFS